MKELSPEVEEAYILLSDDYLKSLQKHAFSLCNCLQTAMWSDKMPDGKPCQIALNEEVLAIEDTLFYTRELYKRILKDRKDEKSM